jgi:hypothetical protein
VKLIEKKKRHNKFVLSEGEIIQPPTTIVGQFESEISVSVQCILNRQHYLLEFQRGLC